MYATAKEIIAKLQKMNPAEKMLVRVWYKSDIKELALDRNMPQVSASEAESTLALIDRTHDGDIGINWDVVQSGIETIRSGQIKQPNHKDVTQQIHISTG
ncbi:DUF1380 family protein [Salmonella enterica]|nr:DUF1380 family protein [Salmonella enterica]EKS4649997.1 DUF1380 family protein [Salmonella enterica]